MDYSKKNYTLYCHESTNINFTTVNAYINLLFLPFAFLANSILVLLYIMF